MTPDGRDHRLDRVGRLQRELELAGDPEPGDGQRLLHPLAERGGGAGVGVVELERERGRAARARGRGRSPAHARRSRALTGGRSRSGRWSSTFRSLCCTQRWTGTSLPNTCRMALRERLRAVDHEQHPLLDVQAAVDEIGQQRGRRPSRSRSSPSHSPSASFSPSVVIPSATMFVRPVQLDPVEHHHRQAQIGQRAVHQLPQLIPGPLHERARHRRLRRRPRAGLDLARRPAPAPGGTGGSRRRRASAPAPRRQLVTVGEMLVGRKRHL